MKTNPFTPMKTATGLVVLTILFQSCQGQVEKIELGESGDTHQYKQLRLFPIRANDAFLKRREDKASYLTLSEAVSAKKVSITEHAAPAGRQVSEPLPPNTSQAANSLERDPMEQQVYGAIGDVNKLFVENHSDDTVLILGGEVVEGGNQDRTIAQDVLLPPHSGKIDLSVFCVEHGRWSADSVAFAVAKSSLAPAKVRKAAMKVANQQEVWNEVANELAENKASSNTQTVNALKQQSDYIATQREFEQALAGAFADDPTVIGVIATAGTEIIGCELFESHELFINYYPNLLQSWVSQAIDFGQDAPEGRKVSDYFESVVKKKLNEEGFLGTARNRKPHVSVFN
jgi:hypothetical protein